MDPGRVPGGLTVAGVTTLEFVVAVSENDVIGRRNRLPWRLSADLKHFKNLTLGRAMLMGRKTYESIGRALPARLNIVLSRSAEFCPGDCIVVNTLEKARRAAGASPALMVIGGAEIYRACMPEVSRIHLTLVHTVIADGDTFFPEWHGPQWQESSRERHAADDKNEYPYSFITLERQAGGRLSGAARA